MKKLVVFSDGRIQENDSSLVIYNSKYEILEEIPVNKKTDKEIKKIKDDLTKKYKTIP